jgi:hypothetical protein
MKLRYEITPQIQDYDSIGESFRPYLMRFDNANKEFTSVSTNKYGFRNTVDHDGQVLDFDKVFAEKESDFGVVLGSSSVFGTGATSDAKSIPSRLAQATRSSWLNFGGRAYNSTQELLLLTLHLKAKPKHIVVFSGVNNLTLAYLAEKTSSVYNSFFGESAFREALNSSSSNRIGLRKSISNLFNEVLLKVGLGEKSIPIRSNKNIEDDYQDILACFERDLFCAKAIADGHGSTLTFFMQPLATWLAKKLSREEEQLFDYLDKLNPSFRVLSEFLGSWKDKYFADMENICLKLGVPFINLNTGDFESPDWLFVDRIHLTDAGYEIAANLIHKQMEL